MWRKAAERQLGWLLPTGRLAAAQQPLKGSWVDRQWSHVQVCDPPLLQSSAGGHVRQLPGGTGGRTAVLLPLPLHRGLPRCAVFVAPQAVHVMRCGASEGAGGDGVGEADHAGGGLGELGGRGAPAWDTRWKGGPCVERRGSSACSSKSVAVGTRAGVGRGTCTQGWMSSGNTHEAPARGTQQRQRKGRGSGGYMAEGACAL